MRQVHTLFVRSAQQVVHELQVQEEVEGVRQEVRTPHKESVDLSDESHLRTEFDGRKLESTTKDGSDLGDEGEENRLEELKVVNISTVDEAFC